MLFMDLQEWKIFSKSYSAALNTFRAEGKHPTHIESPVLSTCQKANYNGHSKIEKNQPLKYKHIYWVTEKTIYKLQIY